MPSSVFFHEERCTCTGTGFTGTYCTVNVNDCASSPCGSNGVCVDGLNSSSCLCNTGFSGATCQTATNSLCQQGGRPSPVSSIGAGLLGNYVNLGATQPVPSSVPTRDSDLSSAGNINFISFNSVSLPGLSETNFMVSWQGAITPAQSGVYNFVVTANGGFRLWLGGSVLIDSWFDEIVRHSKISFLLFLLTVSSLAQVIFFSLLFLSLRSPMKLMESTWTTAWGLRC